jgi:hypothetical protein
MLVTFHRSETAELKDKDQASKQTVGICASRFAFVTTVPHASGDVLHRLSEVAASPEWLDHAADTHHATNNDAALPQRAIGKAN